MLRHAVGGVLLVILHMKHTMLLRLPSPCFVDVVFLVLQATLRQTTRVTLWSHSTQEILATQEIQ